MSTTPKPVTAKITGGPVIDAPGIAETLMGIAESLHLAVNEGLGSVEGYGGSAHLHTDLVDNVLADIERLKLIARNLSERSGSIQVWKCRNCNKTILEHTVVCGDVYKYCDNCRSPKVLNVLRDGVPQLQAQA